MAYHLIQRYGSKEQPKFRKEFFGREPLAVIRAAEYYMAGFTGEFLIEDDIGQIVANNQDIRERCKATRTP